MDKEKIIEDLNNRIAVIDDFQKMAKDTNRPMPITIIGGNARKEELKFVIDLLRNS